ncbi:L,D-transpeptidase [Ensifer soli]|uniref:L,D-transpeptidase n=1 Tax=Ciceribacter sp. sgz301302 TaxID=3342379 RepID=UPI0035B7846A
MILKSITSLAAMPLAGCQSLPRQDADRAAARYLDHPSTMYAARDDGGYRIPGFPYGEVDPRYYRQRVADPTGRAAGTIVVDTARRFLYLVEPNGQAIRYGVSIGREGFAWKGEGVIAQRRAWPRWTPPGEMLVRKPGLARYATEAGSMAPGLSNPLGARALYIFADGRDTLYRIHGTPEWQTVGRAASSGCVRLFQQDIIDLYARAPDGARVVVL